MSNLIDISIKKAEKFAKFGDFVSAKSVIGELLEKYPENPRAKALAVKIDKKSSSQVALSFGPDQKTIDELEFLTNSNQWLSLIQRCLELIEHDERSPLVWNFLGIAQRAKGLPLLAEAAHRRAIELESEHAEAHVNLGRILQERDELELAENHYRKALEVESDNVLAAFNLGTLLDDLHREDEAIEAYLIASEFADAHYNLARLYELRSEHALAVKHLKQYRKLMEDLGPAQ